MIERLVSLRGEFVVNDKDITPTRIRQLEEEIMLFQKELAGQIYYQRCLEKDL
jgi:hypothetical protein